MKTIDELNDDLTLKTAEAEFWLEAKTDHNREAMNAHLKFVHACQEADGIRRALIIANGEST